MRFLLSAAAAVVAFASAPAMAAGERVTPDATVHGCGYYQFCTYANSDYTGMIDRMSSCTWHRTHGLFVAYVNNQTPGTRATFYGAGHQFLSHTKPAFAQGTTSLGYPTFYIRPC